MNEMPKRPTILANGSQMKPAQLRTFHERLARWYKTHGRHALPWRNTGDPYRIWLSEVMLQQTQVATVRDRFYGPFLDRFPTVAALAAAPREAVMKAWEGLGYYRRAGFLHEAAKQLVADGGIAPKPPPLCGSPEATQRLYEYWSALPGIGKNTARAILAFAYQQPVAILEANVKRIVARIFALEHPTDAQLWCGAEALLGNERHLSESSARSEGAQNRKRSSATSGFEHPHDKQIDQRNGLMNPFDYNQAMMDVGSQICTPKNPNCGECPANTLCQGQGEPEIYPAPKAKKRVPVREVNMLVIEEAGGKYYLEKREAALLGGLYGFVQWPVDAPLASALPRGSNIASSAMLGRVTHIYSHFRLEGNVRHIKLSARKSGNDWHTRAQINQRPLSGVDRKIVLLIDNSHTRPKKASKTRRKRSTD